MIIPLSFHLRQAASIILSAAFETNISKAMQEFIIELGKPEMRKATDEQIREKILSFMRGLVGKGLSQEAYDNFESVITTKHGHSSIMKYYADFLLAGAGLRVQKTAEDMTLSFNRD